MSTADQSPPPADDVEVISMTAAEWDAAARARLADLGLTYAELAAKARAGTTSTRETKLWLLIKGTVSDFDPPAVSPGDGEPGTELVEAITVALADEFGHGHRDGGLWTSWIAEDGHRSASAASAVDVAPVAARVLAAGHKAEMAAVRADAVDAVEKVRAVHELELTALIKERDRAEFWADRLADAIAAHMTSEIGEHTSENQPWQNALALLANSASQRFEVAAAEQRGREQAAGPEAAAVLAAVDRWASSLSGAEEAWFGPELRAVLAARDAARGASPTPAGPEPADDEEELIFDTGKLSPSDVEMLKKITSTPLARELRVEFYEDDEPVADVVAAFESCPKGVTARPTPRGQTVWLEPEGSPPDSIAEEWAVRWTTPDLRSHQWPVDSPIAARRLAGWVAETGGVGEVCSREIRTGPWRTIETRRPPAPSGEPAPGPEEDAADLAAARAAVAEYERTGVAYPAAQVWADLGVGEPVPADPGGEATS